MKPKKSQATADAAPLEQQPAPADSDDGYYPQAGGSYVIHPEPAPQGDSTATADPTSVALPAEAPSATPQE